MDLDLQDSTCLVTGASGGIGRAIAEALAAEGARLVLHGHGSFEALQRWHADQTWRDSALCVRADVRRPEEMERVFEEACDAFGRVDVCCANAGVWPRASERLDQCSPERLLETVTVNLMGAAWTARAFLLALAARGPRADGRGAALVFTGSTAGRFGERGHADYAAAKAGLVGLALSLKNEIVQLDPRGRVNVVAPGWTVTHMVRDEIEQPGAIAAVARTMPLRQLGCAADVARAVAWLASPRAAAHVSGEVLTVAGGMEGRVQWELDQIDEDAVRAAATRPPRESGFS